MLNGDIDLVQHWLRQWLGADRHQAITWTNVDFPLARFCGIHLRVISQWAPRLLLCILSLKFIFLTLKQLGYFFQNVILFSNAVHHKCNIFIWNWSNTMNVSSTLWILMAWCFSTRASVATVLTTHPCVSRCLGVKDTATSSRGQWVNDHVTSCDHVTSMHCWAS